MRRVILGLSIGLAGCAQVLKTQTAVPTGPADPAVIAPVVKPNLPPIPVEDFFRNPIVSGYQISPDGKTLAVFKAYKNRMNIFVQPVVPDGKSPQQLTYVEDRDISKMRWKGADVLIFSKDVGGDENDHVLAVNVKNGVVRDLTPFKGVKARIVDDLSESAPNEILIEHNDRSKETFDLYRVNVDSGASKLVVKNDYKIKFWLVDHLGHVRGGSAYDGVSTVLYWDRIAGQDFEAILTTDFRNSFKPLAVSADNKRVLALTNLQRDLEELVELDPKRAPKKFALRTLYSHPTYDLSDGEYSRARKAMSRVSVVTDRRETIFLDADDQSEWETLKARFPKEGLLFVNASIDEQLWVVRTFSDVSHGKYFVYDRGAKSLRDLGTVAPWLDPERMAEMKTIHFTARDGLKIEGYLTLPRVANPSGLPVVVNPHGGPWTRDEWGFNSEVQFLASRGYAVLRLNFRGSIGYGRKFWEASFKQWGGKMQNDLTDGVHWLTKEGIANPKSICIYGGSYGGYATLAGITLTPSLYACAVDYVGISNIFTYLKTIPPYWKPYADMFDQMVGDPVKDKALLEAVSPVMHVDKIRAPLFIAQGANDPRVSKNESDQMVEALHKRGIEVQYMVKNDEGHGFRNEENRFDFYRAMEKFLAKHLNGSK